MILVIHDKDKETLHCWESHEGYLCDYRGSRETVNDEVWHYAFDGKEVCSKCFPGHRLNTVLNFPGQ